MSLWFDTVYVYYSIVYFALSLSFVAFADFQRITVFSRPMHRGVPKQTKKTQTASINLGNSQIEGTKTVS